jgi:2-polyprenyl-3-methyl-5-hydroxy-6-metoxy-1,4-benzoquinol methylase
MSTTGSFSIQHRARLSLGSSNDVVYAMVVRTLAEREAGGDLLDVGCGSGQLWPLVRDRFATYTGVDVVRYDGFPADGQFVAADDSGAIPLPGGSFDVVMAVETIEHVDGPRRFVAELVRLAKPGGWVLVTTPNQLSVFSLLWLLRRGHFAYFAEVPGAYPAHITALLETDLVRIAREQGLVDARIGYSNQSRIPLISRHWPRPFRGRRFSDNIVLSARKPPSAPEPAR